MKIEIEKVTPVRLGPKGIIICRRNVNLHEIAKNLLSDIEHEKDIENPSNFENDRIYALCKSNSELWSRAYVKFRKNNGTPVFQLADESGLVDFNKNKVRVRKVKNNNIGGVFGEIKLMVYGVGAFDTSDPEFILIFNQLFQNQECTSIFGLIEEKRNFAHECYAGDLLHHFNDQIISFREVVIRERITYPSRVRDKLNQLIFGKRAQFFLQADRKKSAITLRTESASSTAASPPADFVLNGRFEIFEIIGEGSFGAVVRGFDMVAKADIAIKIFKSSICGGKKNLEMQKDEARFLENFQKLPHENIIQMLHFIETPTEVFLVFPLMNGSLDMEIYAENYKYSKKRTQEIIRMILTGVKHVHGMNMIHRDLKPENILIDRNGIAKIADFGLATMTRPDQYHMTICGTNPYTAPEQYLKCGYKESVDIWSIGCILAEIKLKRLFISGRKEDQLQNIFDVLGIPTYEDWPAFDWKTRFGVKSRQNLEKMFDDTAFLALLDGLCRFNPKKRMEAEHALQHAFLQDLVQ